MIIPIEQVREMRQQYATITHDARQPVGYDAVEQELRERARDIFADVFAPFPIRADDIIISCITLEDSEPGKYQFVFRATWDPQMNAAQLHGGTRNGQWVIVTIPRSTVTFASSVGSSDEQYGLSGYDTDSRRFVFTHKPQQKAA